MNTGPWDDDDQPLQPDVIEALISIDPYLSDFEAGEIVRRDGEPMTPVEHIRILDATRRDLEAAKAYLRLKREADSAGYDAITRLNELTGPHDDGTLALREVLDRMPAGERAEAEQILRHVKPGTAKPPTDEQRKAEITRLRIAGETAKDYMDGHYPLVADDGEVQADPRTGQPYRDDRINADALSVYFNIQFALHRLTGLIDSHAEVIITAEHAEAKLQALKKRIDAARASGNG